MYWHAVSPMKYDDCHLPIYLQKIYEQQELVWMLRDNKQKYGWIPYNPILYYI